MDTIRASESMSPGTANDSVEALEEALASARVRLQERLADDIEAKRREVEQLRAECDRLRAEATTVLTQANESAERMVHEAKEATERALEESNDAAERVRQEASSAADRMREEASSAAERMLREATDTAGTTLARAQEIAQTMLTRVQECATGFLMEATAEMAALQSAVTSDGGRADAAARAPEEAIEAHKEAPARPVAKGRSPEAGAASPKASAEAAGEGNQATAAAERGPEAVVTRMVVRPLVGMNSRSRIKEKIEAIDGIQAVKPGPIGEESFELLVIHPREVKLVDRVVAAAPKEIVVREQKAGLIELELKDLDWVEKA